MASMAPHSPVTGDLDRSLGRQYSTQQMQQRAPAGYEWDPVQGTYTRTPQSAGERANTFSNAASGGLTNSLAGLLSGGNGAASAPAGNMFGGGGMGMPGGGAPGGGGPVQSGGGVSALQMPDQAEANKAEFARAKDRAGKVARSSIDALNGELGAQGMMGGGAQVQGTKEIIDDAMGQTGEVVRDQAIKNADLRADTAKTNYAGALTLRGQDINAQEANARLALEQRSQQMQLLQLIMQSLGGSKGAASSYGAPVGLY